MCTFNQIWLSTIGLACYLFHEFFNNEFIASFSPCMVKMFHAYPIHRLYILATCLDVKMIKFTPDKEKFGKIHLAVHIIDHFPV